MAWIALNCPQCSAPLPRVALWRSVKCASCGALITRTESVVMRDTFRQALVRARQAGTGSGHAIRCGGQGYELMQLLGHGEVSQVYLAQRIGSQPYLATIKLSSSSAAEARYAREAQVLRELQEVPNSVASAYVAQRLPGVVAQGPVEDKPGQHALILWHPNGCWGSLAALSERFAEGLDPRHAVWIWRRLLDVLGFLHAQGWSHGDVRPEHALVHPRDHGVRLISWASAQSGASAKDQAADLMRSARVILVLLSGKGHAGSISSHVPAELAQLVNQTSEDETFCRTHGATGLDTLLRAAAKEAFGPPVFVPLHL